MQLGKPIKKEIRDSVWDSVRGYVMDTIDNSVTVSLYWYVWDSVSDPIYAPIFPSL